MLQVKYIQFSPRCRKSHVKEQIQYEVTCVSPFLATRYLHVAYDFRVYSQLSLPICRLSAYTLCILTRPKVISSIKVCKVNNKLAASKAYSIPPAKCRSKSCKFVKNYFSALNFFMHIFNMSVTYLSCIKRIQ